MEILNENNEELWKDFAKKKDNLPAQYSLEWKDAIEKSYKNCKSYYYLNAKQGETKTIFPFFLIKSKIFGDKIISQPFLDFGGPQGMFDEEFILELIKDLKEKFEGKAKHIEIRLNNFLPDYKKIENSLLKQGFEKKSERQQFILKLEEEEILWNNFNRIVRKSIKKANKSELRIKKMNNKKEMDAFYKLYLKSMKNFGTPQHSYNYFLNLFEKMKKNFKGLNCYKDGKLISSLIVLYTKGYMYAAYNFSEHKYLIYQPNDLLYWEMIKWAIHEDIKYFDFGQCEANAKEGTHARGIYKFKSKWKADLYERPYFYYYLNKNIPQLEESKNKLKKLGAMWKKLPLPIVKILGPKITSQLVL